MNIKSITYILGWILKIEALFMLLPIFLASFVELVTDSVLIRNLVDAVLRISIFMCYMILVSRMKDIPPVFAYHGAEHKTIFCYEAGLELTVENVKKQKRFHPRCGTSFLILMVLVSIFVSFCVGLGLELVSGYDGLHPALRSAIENETLYNAIRAAIRVGLIPLIVGIGYELIKISGKHDNFITKIISAPGVWLQHITVLEPSDDMIECAIVAMKEVIPEDESDKL